MSNDENRFGTFEIKLAGSKESIKFDDPTQLADYYDRMKPRHKKKTKVNLKSESKTIKSEGKTEVFTMVDKEEVSNN